MEWEDSIYIENVVLKDTVEKRPLGMKANKKRNSVRKILRSKVVKVA